MDTTIVKLPRQNLASFGTTVVTYNMVTRPLYEALDGDKRREESVLRRGTVKAERPQIVTPGYMARARGFGTEAQEFMRELILRGRGDDPALLYTYSNELIQTEIIANRPEEVTARISREIDDKSKPLEAVILGVDELWDVSLMKFIFDLTSKSVSSNARDFSNTGRLRVDDGVPMDARIRIEDMFIEVENGNLDPAVLHGELAAWQIFDDYEDRFFRALRGRNA